MIKEKAWYGFEVEAKCQESLGEIQTGLESQEMALFASAWKLFGYSSSIMREEGSNIFIFYCILRNK